MKHQTQRYTRSLPRKILEISNWMDLNKGAAYPRCWPDQWRFEQAKRQTGIKTHSDLIASALAHVALGNAGADLTALGEHKICRHNSSSVQSYIERPSAECLRILRARLAAYRKGKVPGTNARCNAASLNSESARHDRHRRRGK
jgi:hypothetical protein